MFEIQYHYAKRDTPTYNKRFHLLPSTVIPRRPPRRIDRPVIRPDDRLVRAIRRVLVHGSGPLAARLRRTNLRPGRVRPLAGALVRHRRRRRRTALDPVQFRSLDRLLLLRRIAVRRGGTQRVLAVLRQDRLRTRVQNHLGNWMESKSINTFISSKKKLFLILPRSGPTCEMRAHRFSSEKTRKMLTFLRLSKVVVVFACTLNKTETDFFQISNSTNFQ